MKSAGKVLFVVLSFAALFIVGYDYTCGHMGASPFVPDECPLCAAFSATDFVSSFVGVLLFLGLMVVTGVIALDRFFLPRDIEHSLLTGRSPPLA